MSCNNSAKNNKPSQEKNNLGLSVLEQGFGSIGSDSVALYVLKNESGMSVEITNYGGIITKIITPDRNGEFADIVLGYDSLAQYVEKTPYFGAFVGRYANRIAKGTFTLNGKSYQLETNNGPNALHGGEIGLDKKIWKAESFKTDQTVGLELSILSHDNEEGYPGNLSVQIKYELNNQNELRINYSAETDKSTVVNFTNHSYFNLLGADQGSIIDHVLQINADSFTPVDETSIPTGEIRAVGNTPFDFNLPMRIGERIEQTENDQINIGNGYDHNFVLRKSRAQLELAARVEEPTKGRVLEVLTTEPGVQLYTANYLGKKFKGKKGKAYASRDAFCLETQHFPDSPNQPHFPTTVLNPNEMYMSTTVFRFSVKK